MSEREESRKTPIFTGWATGEIDLSHAEMGKIVRAAGFQEKTIIYVSTYYIFFNFKNQLH